MTQQQLDTSLINYDNEEERLTDRDYFPIDDEIED